MRLPASSELGGFRIARLRSIVSISLRDRRRRSDCRSPRAPTNASSALRSKIFGPHDPRGARLGQLDRDDQMRWPSRAHRAAHDVVDVQHAARLPRAPMPPLVQGEHGALGDDEQAAQLREPRDHVVRERVGRAAARVPRGRRSTNGMTAIERGARRAATARAFGHCWRRDGTVRGRLRRSPSARPARMRSAIESFDFEQAGRWQRGAPRLRGSGRSGERAQQPFVHARSNGASCTHLLEVSERLRVGNALTTCSSSATCHRGNRRRCAVS